MTIRNGCLFERFFPHFHYTGCFKKSNEISLQQVSDCAFKGLSRNGKQPISFFAE